ncbi:MAG: methyltransferase domain-containing protein [Trueperaceae bacterium]|nr:MAG: methyltransferase domain-containing protein [Trueperaceae bacterium]
MTGEQKSFKQLEQEGFHAKAHAYGNYVGAITAQAVEPVLDAVQTTQNTHFLDVATGPGYFAGGAAARGAQAVGVDFAPNMVVEATQRFPNATFRQGDAEALDFETGTFDAVTCPFGLLHFADADQAIAEAFRVLKPGGWYAFTVWDTPDKHDFFGIILDALQTHGMMDIPLPEAPPIFRFSDPLESERVLTEAGFTDVRVEGLPLVWETNAAEDLLLLLEYGTVRTQMLLQMQPEDHLKRIYKAIYEGASRLERDGRFVFSWPAVMSVGRKPL